MQKKKKDFTPLSSQLQGLFANKNWAMLWQTYKLAQKWAVIAGKDIAKKSEPAYIQNDILWVYVESSVLMQHMQIQKLQLLRKINDVVTDTKIEDIRWAMRPAENTAQPMHSTTRKRSVAAPEEKKAFDAMASTVEDKQCRDALKKLWDVYNNS
jgi:hypothetical protein